MTVCECVGALIEYAKSNLALDGRDELYVRNRVLEAIGFSAYRDTAATYRGEIGGLLGELTDACIKEGLFSAEEAEEKTDAVMGALSLSPSAIDERFHRLCKTDGNAVATEWFYDYCVCNDYVKKAKLDQNPRFEAAGLIITINKAKPEFRDPKKAVSGNSVAGGYPACSICRDNEGFGGRNKRTLRTVSLTLGGEPWFWQFSPYGYFYQHGIAVNCVHTPMHVDESTFYRLMDFVDLFPHWFIGCNAPLPRIGGSVLAHDHYQGGGEVLPMHRAKAAFTLDFADCPEATAEVLDWAGTVVRIVSRNRTDIAKLCELIRRDWVKYDNRELGIVAEDEDGIHNAVSPTVVRTERGYEMSLILRSNITSERYPDGVFHAHPEYHVIKKESIGLIEAQGLFILPGRLEGQLSEISSSVAEGKPLPQNLREFESVYCAVKAQYRQCPEEGADGAVKAVLGDICNCILENTAVFKTKRETVEYLKCLGFTE